MGCYVNPRSVSKEEWLLKNGKLVGGIKSSADDCIPKFQAFPVGTAPVVLMDNGMFTAAGVAYCEAEYEDFTRASDARPRLIYEVEVEKLLGVSDLDYYLSTEACRR